MAAAAEFAVAPGALVFVSGANGFVARELVAQLLAAGYNVRGSVRPSTLSKPEKIATLTALRALHPERTLELVGAELLDEGAFDAHVQGCACVMHTASPYVLTVEDPVRDLIEPAVNGTLNVLRAAQRAGVPHVVLTSSMAAVTDSPVKGHVYTEADFNDKSTEKRNPYYCSKVRAERAAWDFVAVKKAAGEAVFRLVSINPFLICGPEPGEACNTSNAMFRDLMDGKYPALMDLSWNFIDVRDVARSHIAAMQRGAAQGRYICAHDAVHMKDVVALLREKYPEHKLPKRDLSCRGGTALTKLGSFFQPKGTGSYLRTNLGRKCLMDCSKIRTELGIEFMPLVATIIDTVEDLRTSGKLNVPVGAVTPAVATTALPEAEHEEADEAAASSADNDDGGK